MSVGYLSQMREDVFAYVLALPNFLETAFEKAKDDLTLKQWMLLDAVGNYPKTTTLTDIGYVLGCSRQNAKNIAMALSKKGYVELILKGRNSVNIKITRISAPWTNSPKRIEK